MDAQSLELVIPATPEEAADRFTCVPYQCQLSGDDCARRYIKAQRGELAALSMRACRVCPAGAARARLLDPDYVPDPLDGRRLAFAGKRGRRPGAGAKRKGRAGPPPACVRCGTEREQTRRAATDPRWPYCAICVGYAARRLRHHIDKPTPKAVAMILAGGETKAAVAVALTEGATAKGSN